MPYESDVFFVRMFWTTNSVFKTQICDYSCYQFLEWASVVCLSRNLAISSRLLNFFSLKFIFPYCPLNIYRICNYVTSLIPNFGLPHMCLHTFFSPWLVWLKFYQFYWSLRTRYFWLHRYSQLIFVFHFIDLNSYLYYFFCSFEFN